MQATDTDKLNLWLFLFVLFFPPLCFGEYSQYCLIDLCIVFLKDAVSADHGILKGTG